MLLTGVVTFILTVSLVSSGLSVRNLSSHTGPYTPALYINIRRKRVANTIELQVLILI